MVCRQLVFGALLLAAATAQDFAKYKDCWSCTGDGWGWCPIARKCGGFANKNCGEKDDERYYREDSAPKVKSDCTILTEANFDKYVDGSKHVLVEFFAPWCGHCKQLKPAYEKVCRDFSGEQDIVIATVDATAHHAVGQRYMVQGYPTIKYFAKGADVDTPIDYEGGRSEADFVDFINKNANTEVSVGGGVTPKAGRSNELDGAVFAFYQKISEGKSEAEEVVRGAEKLADGAALGDFYLSTLRKVLEKGHGHVTSQVARLGNMVSGSSNLKPAKATEFRKKINVLNVFVDAHNAAGGKAHEEL